jgi:hypothetical protein
MKKKTLATLAISFLLLSTSITGCGSSMESENSTEISTEEVTPSVLTELVGKFMQEWSSCVPGFQEGTATCVVGYTVMNPTDAPIEITYVDVYAVVDGKIFKAASDQGSDGVGALTQTWSPGEELKAGTYFDVPEGSIMEKIFFASEPSIDAAEMILDINLEAISS